MLKTYFRLGGLQIQINGVSPELLRKARQAPERHRDVLVRIAGYTQPFVNLNDKVQDEMIRQMVYEV